MRGTVSYSATRCPSAWYLEDYQPAEVTSYIPPWLHQNVHSSAMNKVLHKHWFSVLRVICVLKKEYQGVHCGCTSDLTSPTSRVTTGSFPEVRYISMRRMLLYNFKFMRGSLGFYDTNMQLSVLSGISLWQSLWILAGSWLYLPPE